MAACVSVFAAWSEVAVGQATGELGWAEVLEQRPDPAVVSDVGLRSRIVSSGLPWLVKDKATGIELVLVPPGTFVQGSPSGSTDARADESPTRPVTLSEAFYIGRRELTRAEWARLSGETAPASESAQLPATNISHAKAADVFVRHGLRLPSEAEWEYASHACGTWSHEGALDAFCWHRGNSEGGVHAVGSLQPNALGLYDMLGNVEEWCIDWYSAEEYAGDSKGVQDPLGPPSGLKRVLRGGSWMSRTASCRSASRGCELPQFESSTVGVRAARSALESREAAPKQEPTQTESSSRRGEIPKLDDWAEVIELRPDPKVVTDARLRGQIEQTGLPWRVKDRGTGIELLLVPPGTYRRGASPGDPKAAFDERPAHDVTLTRPYYLGRFEVSRAQWQAAMGTGPSSDSVDPRAPIESVNRDDIAKFNQRTGLRLPTEAEWEYACRAGTTTARYGDLDVVAWHQRNAGSISHPVGLKQANALGFHDMLGNVWEWCSDWYATDEYERSADGVVDPKGPSTGTGCVLRGGSWMNDWSCRSSHRSPEPPTSRLPARGFRALKYPSKSAN